MKKCCEKSIKLDEIVDSFNVKRTHSKLDIIKTLISSKKPISAKELSLVLPNYNESTIFRNLNQFKDLGIINEIDLNEGHKRYEIKPKNHHHHYAKCNNCSNVIQLNTCDIDIFKKQLKKIGFQIETHKIEIFGKCQKCL